VKWNHARGARSAVSERLRGSRAERAVRGAERLRGLGIAHPDAVAVAERRRRVASSELPAHALPGRSAPLPALMPQLLAAPRRRRASRSRSGARSARCTPPASTTATSSTPIC
jgi:hypothetical protein